MTQHIHEPTTQPQYSPFLLFLVFLHGLESSASKSSLICFTAQGTLAWWSCPRPRSWNGLPPNLNPILFMRDPLTVLTPNPTSTRKKGMLSMLVIVDLVLLGTRPDCSAVGLASAAARYGTDAQQPPESEIWGQYFEPLIDSGLFDYSKRKPISITEAVSYKSKKHD